MLRVLYLKFNNNFVLHYIDFKKSRRRESRGRYNKSRKPLIADNIYQI